MRYKLILWIIGMILLSSISLGWYDGIAYYNFDKNINDSGSLGYNYKLSGTYSNFLDNYYSSNNMGSMINFIRADNTILTNNTFNNAADIRTIDFWVNVTSPCDNNDVFILLGDNDTYNNRLQFYGGNTCNVVVVTFILDGITQWEFSGIGTEMITAQNYTMIHLVLVWNTTDAIIYRNGIRHNSNKSASFLNNADFDNIFIGGGYTGGTYYPSAAQIDNVFISDSIYTADDVNISYNFGLGYNFSSTYNFTINSPQNKSYSEEEIVFNITAQTGTIFSECQYSLDNWVSNQTMQLITTTSAWNITNLTSGGYDIGFWCNNTFNNGMLESLNFSIDTSIPKVNLSTLYNGKVFLYGYNISLNLTLADDNSDLTHINITVDSSDNSLSFLKLVNATGEWYYNISFNTTLLNLTTTNGNLHYLNVTLNDSINHSTSTLYTFNLVNASLTYSAEIYEGLTGTYNLSILLNAVNGYTPRLNATAQFYYNNTFTNYTRFTYEADFGGSQPLQHRWDSSFITPFVDITTTFQNYYDLYLYDRNYTGIFNYYNISFTQTVIDANISSCTNLSKAILNITLYSEDEPSSRLLGDIQMVLNYSTTPDYQSVNYSSFNLTGAETYQICTNITGATQPIYVNLYIVYNTTNGFTHRYFLNNETIYAGTPRYVSLYNFNTTTDISDLRITLRDINDYSYVKDVYSRLERFYVGENVWRIVQMDKSDDFGFVDYNVRERTTDYRITFFDSQNNIIKQSTTLKFACSAGVCEVVFLINPLFVTAIVPNIMFSSAYNNNTGIVNLTWVDNSNVISSLRTIVTKETGRDSFILCDYTQTGYSGYVSCNTSAVTGLIQLRAISTSGIIGEKIEKTEYFDANSWKLYKSVGVAEGSWWSFGILLTAALFGSIVSVFVGVVALIFGSIVIYLMGLMSGWNLITLVAVIVLGLIVGVILRKER